MKKRNLILSTVLIMGALACFNSCGSKSVAGTYVTTFNESLTAKNSLHQGYLSKYPSTTTDTLTLDDKNNYSLIKEVKTTPSSEKQIDCKYTFTGTYEKNDDGSIKLSKATTCSYKEDYGEMGNENNGFIANKEGDEKTDPTCLEYFNSGYVNYIGNTFIKVKLDSSNSSFNILSSYMAIENYWGKASNFVEQQRKEIVANIRGKYETRTSGEIVYYGASNFRLWKTMEEDMYPYIVQNHGIGSSTDVEQINYAEELLYSFKPSVVFIQTGSNGLEQGATREEFIANKQRMYEAYHEHLPDATLIVMAGIPMPKRQNIWEDMKATNAFIKEYVQDKDYIHFIDATDQLLADEGEEEYSAGDGKYFNPGLFIEDGIHFNDLGRPIWTNLMKDKLAELNIDVKYKA